MPLCAVFVALCVPSAAFSMFVERPPHKAISAVIDDVPRDHRPGGVTRVVSRAGGACKSRVRSLFPHFFSRRQPEDHEAPRRVAVLAARGLTDRDFGLAIAAKRAGTVGTVLCRRWRHCVGGGGFSVVLRGPRAVSVHKKNSGLTPTPPTNGQTPDSNPTTGAPGLTPHDFAGFGIAIPR